MGLRETHVFQQITIIITSLTAIYVDSTLWRYNLLASVELGLFLESINVINLKSILFNPEIFQNLKLSFAIMMISYHFDVQQHWN